MKAETQKILRKLPFYGHFQPDLTNLKLKYKPKTTPYMFT